MNQRKAILQLELSTYSNWITQECLKSELLLLLIFLLLFLLLLCLIFTITTFRQIIVIIFVTTGADAAEGRLLWDNKRPLELGLDSTVVVIVIVIVHRCVKILTLLMLSLRLMLMGNGWRNCDNMTIVVIFNVIRIAGT